MKCTKKFKSLIFAILTSMMSVVSSCSDDIDYYQEGQQNDNAIDLAAVSTDWNNTQEDVVQLMNGYKLLYEDANSLIYTNPLSNQSISYAFSGGLLTASSIVFMTQSQNGKELKPESTYDYIGDVSDGHVYADISSNTLAIVWQQADGDVEYSAIGYTPIFSEAFGDIEAYGVTTNEQITVEPYRAEATGRVTGTDKECEAGFIYGMSPDFPEGEYQTKTTRSKGGDFKATFTGLLGDQKYYYRAFAKIDNITYWGEIMSFQSRPITYTMNGVIYDMIRVDGGPYGDFYIMQTEIIPTASFYLGNIPISKTLDGNHDGYITLGEYRLFVTAFINATGLSWRMPSSEEWKYAYSGGNLSKGFTYSGSDNLDDIAWYISNSNSKSHDVCTKKANELGIFDMCGNFAEMTYDGAIEVIKGGGYASAATVSYQGDAYGGSWKSPSNECTKESRLYTPGARNQIDGSYITVRFLVDCNPKAFVTVK